MTYSKLALLTFVDVALGVLMKAYYFKNFYAGASPIGLICLWILTAVIAAACVRRFGVINFLEAAFVGTVWVVVTLFADLVITAAYTGNQLFGIWQYWASIVVTVGIVLVFHKMRHVHVRHQLHEAKHAKEHGHGAGHTH